MDHVEILAHISFVPTFRNTSYRTIRDEEPYFQKEILIVQTTRRELVPSSEPSLTERRIKLWYFCPVVVKTSCLKETADSLKKSRLLCKLDVRSVPAVEGVVTDSCPK